MTATAKKKRALPVYRCQFCEQESPARDWKSDKCPKCGRAYDPILAQEGDD
jgi:Zn finger protein HypA/HybF involved in hydrogenase expression